MNSIDINDQIKVGEGEKLLLLAGPCQIESLEHSLMIARRLKEITEKYPCNLIYKSSYDKANRTSLKSKRGVGIEKGLEILGEVKEQVGLPVVTDIHDVNQVKLASEVADILQIPAFLCRQTDLLVAAGETGRVINIKKGQFLHPSDMHFSAEKVASSGNKNILLCERGTCFGYRDLVVDPRNFLIMKDIGYPVIYDATHSVAVMGGENGSSGGNREFIKPLIRGAVAIGVHGLFIECHENPETAPSDGKSMLEINKLEGVLEEVFKIRSVI